ncbi:MAG: cupin domain-containing protein [Pseudomonadota bacterium]
MDVQEEISALNIGRRVRQFRLKRDLTLKDVSEATGLSKPLLSQIENNVSAPPIATLLKISKALTVDISAFFQSRETARGIAVVRAAERVKSIRRRGDDGAAVAEYRYESLAHPFSFKMMEPFVVEIESRDLEQLVYYQHRGEEFIFVLEGRVAFHSEEKTITLDSEDSLYFDSGIPHALRRVGDGTARILAVVCAPDQH